MFATTFRRCARSLAPSILAVICRSAAPAFSVQCPYALLQLLLDTFIERTRCTLGKLESNSLQYMCRHGVEIHPHTVLVCVFVHELCNESTHFIQSTWFSLLCTGRLGAKRGFEVLTDDSHNSSQITCFVRLELQACLIRVEINEHIVKKLISKSIQRFNSSCCSPLVTGSKRSRFNCACRFHTVAVRMLYVSLGNRNISLGFANCNVPLFQVNIQGLATQFLMLDAKLANGALSMTSGLRTKIPLQGLQGYPCRFCTAHLTFVAIESTAINQYLCQHLNFFLLVQRIVGVFLAHQATIGNTPQDLSCLFFLGRFYF